jgi:hypothetical protein
MVATLTLVLSPRADEPGLIMVAARTAEAIGPFSLNEIPQAIALGAKSPPELSGCH